jgi:hypothetical protein
MSKAMNGAMNGLLLSQAAYRQPYFRKVLSTRRSNLIAYWPLWDTAGNATDLSPRNNYGIYRSATLGQAGIGDGKHGISVSGNDSGVQIDVSQITFENDWNGNLYSMIAWGRVDGAARWTDASTYRYLSHIRAADTTYYTCMGKTTTSHQIEWRRRTGGPIVSYTHTFAPSGPTGWFCMGMTHDRSAPYLRFYLNGVRLSESTSANLTDWGNHPPEAAVSLLYAGSLTLQEWIGGGAHCAIWNAALTDTEMKRAMTR